VVKNNGEYSIFVRCRDSNGNELSSGIYFIRVTTGPVKYTKKLVIVR